MSYVTYDTYIEWISEYSVLPMYREIPCDLETPISIHMKARGTFLLESLEKGFQVGRYSIVGIGRLMEVTLRGNTLVTMEYRNGSPTNRIETETSDPLVFLREMMKRLNAPPLQELPPFWGGLVGYLGYEIAGFLEDLPLFGPGEEDIPDALLVIPESVVVFDSVKRTATIVVTTLPKTDPDHAYHHALEEIQRLEGLIREAPCSLGEPEESRGVVTGSTPDRERFEEMVSECVDSIRAGDLIQAVLSRKTTLRTEEDPFSLYRKLRRTNPSPYMFFLDFGDFILAGSSPEMMVRVSGDEIFLKPIAGTRPRGATVKEDCLNAEDLLSDPKETAEHLMLVDLGRNDLGRVSVPGSVEVTEPMNVERFSHVMHIVTSLRGRLEQGLDAFDVIRASFPAGTLTGAPKIRAMQRISQLEGTRRGHYGGMVFYLGFNGNMDSCITIRSMLFSGGEVVVQSGAGIVADSLPENEYRETVSKAEALISVITGERGKT